MAVLGYVPLQAVSLGDVVAAEQRKAAGAPAKVSIGTGEVAGVHVTVQDAALTKYLYMPDAMRSCRNVKPQANDYIILFVRGTYTNKNRKKQYMKSARFVSASGKIFEGEDLFAKGSDASPMLSLNPDETSEFMAYFQIPVTEVMGGSLLCAEDGFVRAEECRINLKLSAKSEVSDKLTRGGITSNVFDASF